MRFGTLKVASCLALLAISCEAIESKKSRNTSETWSSILKAFEQHSANDLREIERLAALLGTEPELKLAQILLQEWKLFPESPTLRQPRPVLVPPVPAPEGVVQGGVFPIRVEVNASGGVVRADFVQQVPDQRIAQLIMESIVLARFRPAISEGRFADGTAIITVRVEVQ